MESGARAWRLTSAIGCAVAMVAGCDGPSPATPSPGPVAISNLVARQLGVEHSLCNRPFSYAVIDELWFDVNTPFRSTILGATVVSQEEGQPDASLGTVGSCTAPVDPCSGDSVCLVEAPGSPMRVRVQKKVVWTPQRSWSIGLVEGGRRGNTLHAVLNRPAELPWGTVAAIADLQRLPGSHAHVSWRLVVFSPGVPGRTITVTFEADATWGHLFTDVRPPVEEVAGRNEVVFDGSILRVDATIRAIIEERDASGALLARETRTIQL